MNGIDPGWFQALATVVAVVVVVFGAGWRLGAKINDLKVAAAAQHSETKIQLAKVDTKILGLDGKLTEKMRTEITQSEKAHRTAYHKFCGVACQGQK